MSKSESNLLPCPFCGSKPERFVENDILHIKCPECVSVGLYNHVRFGCLSDALWNKRSSSNHCEPEATSPDQIELGKLAAFGKIVWDWIKQNPDFCGDEFALTLMPMAEKAGLCKYEVYDPEKHGEFADLVPGEDELYYWGKS